MDGSTQSQKQVLTLKALSNASARRDAEEEGDDEIEDNRLEWQKDDVYSDDEYVSDKDELASVNTDDLTVMKCESDLKAYSEKTTRYIKVDQCNKNCCVYVGENKELFSCPKCNDYRYRPCANTFCPQKGSQSCNHLRKQGTAYKHLFYRPLLMLIADLLRTKHFITALHYMRSSSSDLYKDSYSDFMDGDVAKENLTSMDSNFIAWKEKNEKVRSGSVPVNLLLSEFYDGGQLFKSIVTNFWGLFIQILNLPPTYRGKLGVGMFVQAIYAGTHTKAEAFLFPYDLSIL